MLSEETDPVHAKAAAALYSQVSRGWFVLPRGTAPAPQWTRNYSSATDADTQVTAEIARLVAAGHLLDWDDAQAQFPNLQGKDRPTVCLTLGFVQKTVDGRVKVRMVLDASAPHDGTSLNDTIDVPPTRLPSVRKIEASLADLDAGAWIWKCDLRDAFHLQPCATESVDHLGIYWHGRFCVYAKMPFGIASAPSAMQTFSCAVMRAAMRWMTTAGLTCGPMPGYDHLQQWAGYETTPTATLPALLLWLPHRARSPVRQRDRRTAIRGHPLRAVDPGADHRVRMLSQHQDPATRCRLSVLVCGWATAPTAVLSGGTAESSHAHGLPWTPWRLRVHRC